MANDTSSTHGMLAALAHGAGPALEMFAQMQLTTMEQSGLDAETYTLVRVAAMIAAGAAPAQYAANLAVAEELDVDAEKLKGTLLAIAPIVGSASVVSAASNLVRASELATDGEQI